MSGYKAIGVIAIRADNGSDGNGRSNANIYDAYLNSAGNLSMSVRNISSSSTINIYLIGKVLYVKNS